MLIVLWLTFLICIVNLKYAVCIKCGFETSGFGYTCEIIPDSSSIEEKHADGKTDDNVKTIVFDGKNKKDLTQSVLSPFCQRFKNVDEVNVWKVKSVNENSFQPCKNLKNIWIVHSEMEEIPENLFSHQSTLTRIALNGGKLRTLPENVFSNQKELQWLFLWHNQISCLPPNIFKSLTKLRFLNLVYNKIQSLNPKWFENLQSLKWLKLYHNNIQDLPKNVFAHLDNLEKLDLYGNQLTTIHSDSFGNLRNLAEIYLKNNKINASDEKLINNTAVIRLDMRGNVCSNKDIKERNKIKGKLSNCFSNYQSREEPSKNKFN